MKFVWAVPIDGFCFGQLKRRDSVIEICEALHRACRRLQIIKFAGVLRFAARKGDLAIAADGDVNPKCRRWTNLAERNAAGGAAVERLDPQADTCSVIRADEQRFSVGKPERALNIAIDGAGDICAFTARG